MAFCRECGCELLEDARYCTSCGHEVETAYDDARGRRKTVWEGTVHRCPECGASVSAFEGKCPACGYEFRDVASVGSARELSNRLDAIEANRPKEKDKRRIKLNWYDDMCATDKQKVELIRNYPIPNTKEDLIEFIILALSNSNITLDEYGSEIATQSERALSSAWTAKLDQAMDKAKLLLDEKDLARLYGLYKDNRGKIDSRKAEGKRKLTKLYILSIIAFIEIISIMIIVFSGLGAVRDSEAREEEQRLQEVVTSVYELVEDEEYDLARLKANELVFNPKTVTNDEAEEKWSAIQDEVMEMIDEAEKRAES